MDTKTTTQIISTTIISHLICTCTALIPPGLWQSSLCSHSGTDEQFWKAMKVLLCARICSIKAISWTFLHTTLENRMTTFFKQIQTRLVPHSHQQNMFSSTTFNPFTPKIWLVILLTICHTILMMLVQRIWYWIN